MLHLGALDGFYCGCIAGLFVGITRFITSKYQWQLKNVDLCAMSTIVYVASDAK
jgi:hypothetical protein